MNVLVGSLQYSPVYKSHCLAFGRQCESVGHSLTYMFSNDYSWMLDQATINKSVFIGESGTPLATLLLGLRIDVVEKLRKLIINGDFECIYMHNLHPFLSPWLARTSRSMGVRYVQHVHEPYSEDKSVYGGLQQLWLHAYEFQQGRTLKSTEAAVLSSTEAVRLFKERYAMFPGKILEIPLMYEDACESILPPEEREFVTLIGPMVPAKNPELLSKIITKAAEIAPHLRFQLISRKRSDDNGFLRSDNVEIRYKERISDAEFVDMLRRSIVVLAPYKSVRQSSTVATSYMCGVPVITSDLPGFREIVENGRTGILMRTHSTPNDWIEAILWTSERMQDMSKACRERFERTYSEVNWKTYLREILG